MEYVNERGVPASARSSRWLKRAVVATAASWLLLMLAFGVYYLLDQQSRDASSQQTVLHQQIQRAEEAVRSNSGNVAARTVVADLYAQAGRFEEAALQYEESLQINENNLAAVNGLAAVYAQLGQAERAMPLLEDMIVRSGDSKLVRASADFALARLALGKIYLSQGRLDEAKAQAEEAALAAPTNADVRLLSGEVQAVGGDFEGAVEQYKKALRFVPKFPEAYQGLAAAYEGLGDLPRASYARVMVIYSQEDYQQAATALEQLVRDQPGLAEAHLGLGMAYERTGKRDEAVAEYREALRLDAALEYAKVRLGGLGKEVN